MENQNTNSQQEAANETPAASAEFTHQPEDLDAVLNEELDQVAKLEKELFELKDSNLRLIAEMQNTLKRAQDEAKKARDYAISHFAKEIITVKDYLEMALKDQSGNFEMLKLGVDLTLQQLVKVFETQNVKDIAPLPGEKLDANLHQAMSVVEEHQQEANTIVAVMQKGYLLNGRVLRPAMVTVAK